MLYVGWMPPMPVLHTVNAMTLPSFNVTLASRFQGSAATARCIRAWDVRSEYMDLNLKVLARSECCGKPMLQIVDPTSLKPEITKLIALLEEGVPHVRLRVLNSSPWPNGGL